MSVVPPDQDVDRFCLRCAYNLRGLAGDPVRCPECGTPNLHMARFFAGQYSSLWGQRYRVRDATDEPVFEIRQVPLRLTREFALSAPDGREEVRIRRRLRLWNPIYDILRNRVRVATLSARAFGTSRQAFCVEVGEGTKGHLDGERTLSECTIRRGEIIVATSRLKHFSLRDTYDIDIALGEDVPVLLGVLLVIDIAPI
jgi:uncharacterized protein YxjI